MAAWYEPQVMCKKHPNQRQQPGFCSSCLSERLSKLPSFTFTMAPPSRSSSSSLSSSPAFNSSSASTSPTHHHHHHHHRKTSSSGTGFNHFIIHGKNGLMRKSKSIAYVTRKRARNGLDGKKKEGFWSKLLRSTSTKTKEALVHAKNGKERFKQ